MGPSGPTAGPIPGTTLQSRPDLPKNVEEQARERPVTIRCGEP